MITYKEACKQAGYDHSVACPIESKVTFFAYKAGVSKEFSTREEATKYSKNVESVSTNKKEIKEWWDSRRKLEQAADCVWEEALKADYIDVGCSEDLFDAYYAEAYDRGHSSGHDEVAYYMSNIYEFALKVRQIK